MPIPTSRILVNTLPDPGDSHVFREDWTNEAAARARWAIDANPLADPAQCIFLPDDGLMGGPFLRLNTPSQYACQRVWTNVAFDHTQAIRAIWRWRVVYDGNGPWTGPGVFYGGEPCYVGLWTSGHLGTGETGTPGPAMAWGLYTDDEVLASGDVIDVEMEWVPATRMNRMRVLPDGVWHERYCPDVGTSPSLDEGHPVHLLFQGPSFMPDFTGGYLDIGLVKVWGSPRAGWGDHCGFGQWEHTRTVFYGGSDLGRSAYLGGITGRGKTHASTYIGFATIAQTSEPAAAQTWEARSPIIGVEPGKRYKHLDFVRLVPVANASTLRVHVRNASTGELLPDAQVPLNSTGIDSVHAPPYSAPTWNIYTKRIALTDVPAGTEIFLDVQGETLIEDTPVKDLQRLGGAWVTFEDDAASPDTTAPTITGFTLPSSPHPSTSVTVTVTATDAVGVAEYAITVDTLDAPTSWQVSPDFSLTVAEGAHTLRAYARDAALNVSDPSVAEVTVALPPDPPPPSEGVSLLVGGEAATVMVGAVPVTVRVGPI